jgi:hypothetical protein
MKQVQLGTAVVLVLLCACVLSQAQQVVATNTNVVVPPLVKFGGTLTDVNGKPLSGIVGVTFALYKDQQGGAPLWLETQNVTADKNGHYSIMLGSTSSEGLPTDLFASGEARWLGVQPEGQGEQPRVLLLSVPYALKAGDAQTLGGLPASAFVLAAPPNSGATSASAESAAAAASASVSPATTSDVTTSGGTVNAIPLFSTATNIQNSLLTQTGTTAINVGGTLNLPATGAATAATGKNSQPQDFVASAYNSGSSAAVAQTFQLQAEPAGNDTASSSGTLNILFASGTTTPAETGLKIASNGVITFASGQTFPGTGSGTVTSVGSGAGLTGGPITSSGSLGIATGGVTNAMLANPSLTVTAGTGLTGGGTVALGSSATLNVDTTKIPLLSAANTFTGNQTVDGTVTAQSSTSNGIVGSTASANGYGVEGSVTSTVNGTGAGVYGTSSNPNGYGVEGSVTSTARGTGTGVYGTSSSNGGYGVVGVGVNTGVLGRGNTTGNGTGVAGVGVAGVGGIFGVTGEAQLTSGSAAGVLGTAYSPNGYGVEGTGPGTGVYGTATGTGSVVGVSGTTSSSGGYGVTGQSPNVGVAGTSTASGGYGVQGYSTGGTGVQGVDLSTTGAWVGVHGGTLSSSGYGVEGTSLYVGVYGTSSGSSGYGVEGASSNVGVYGTASGSKSYGMEGASPNVGVFGHGTGSGGIGVDGHGTVIGLKGIATATSGTVEGVYGQSNSAAGYGVKGSSAYIGVYGAGSGESKTGQSFAANGTVAGVWGDVGTNTAATMGVVGTGDATTAGGFANNVADVTLPTLLAYNGSQSDPFDSLVFETTAALGGTCTIDADGDLSCSGSTSAVAQARGGQRVSLYAVHSAENWFEDFGSGRLVNGVATVALDPTFASTVNTTTEYHVFLTPKGDCKGLYLANETATGFEVRELGGGRSNVAFDYRIVAKRAGYEEVRLADVTDRYNKMRQQQQLLHKRLQQH